MSITSQRRAGCDCSVHHACILHVKTRSSDVDYINNPCAVPRTGIFRFRRQRPDRHLAGGVPRREDPAAGPDPARAGGRSRAVRHPRGGRRAHCHWGLCRAGGGRLIIRRAGRHRTVLWIVRSQRQQLLSPVLHVCSVNSCTYVQRIGRAAGTLLNLSCRHHLHGHAARGRYLLTVGSVSRDDSCLKFQTATPESS